MRSVLGTVLGLYLGLAAIAAIVLAALSVGMVHLFELPRDQGESAALALLILGGRSVLGLPLNLYRAALHGNGLVRYAEASRVGTILIYGVSAWLGLAAGLGLVGLAVATLGSSLINWAITARMVNRLLPGLRIGLRHFSRTEAKSTLRLSMAFVAGNLSALINSRIDTFVLQALVGLHAVALYALAARLADNLLLLTKQFIHALSPAAAERTGSNDAEGVRQLATRGTKYALAITLPVVVPLLLLGRPLLETWIGPEFAGSHAPLRILVISVALSVVWLQASGVLAMIGHHRFDALTALGAAGLNLAITIPLAAYLGAVGAALGSLTSVAVVGLGVSVPRMLQITGLPAGRYLRRAIWPTLPPWSQRCLLDSHSSGGCRRPISPTSRCRPCSWRGCTWGLSSGGARIPRSAPSWVASSVVCSPNSDAAIARRPPPRRPKPPTHPATPHRRVGPQRLHHDADLIQLLTEERRDENQQPGRAARG